MFNRRLTTALVALAATAGAGAMASTASADVVDNDGFSLAGAEVGFDDGNVAFDWNAGVMTPVVTGTLWAEDADNTCVRILVEAYNDDVLVDTDDPQSRCLFDENRHEWPIDRHFLSDPTIDKVVVSAQQQTLTGWSTEASREIEMHLFGDAVTVTAAGIDIGGTAFAGGAPTSPGFVRWSMNDGQVTPSFEGRLHLTNFAGLCGRVRLRYLSDTGALLNTVASVRNCPANNAHHNYPVSLSGFTSGLVSQVEVQAQTQTANGWTVAGATTVSIAE